jgi:ubiquinone/menaquinone biosynthesis C-methylase UbiE
MAERFTAVAIAAAERGRHMLGAQAEVAALLNSRMARVLDIGTRTGGVLLAAAELTPGAVGIDIAFRWLIVARKRLEEAGLTAQLACCCAEHLPFKNGAFDVAVAENVLEHAANQQALVKDARRVLRSGGVFFATTWNRLSPAPEPHVRLWGVGWMPLSWRRGYVRWRKGVSYDHVRLLSSRQVRRMARAAGFEMVRIALPRFSPAELANIASWQRTVVGGYHAVKDLPVLRMLLRVIAPVVHVVARKKNGE